MIENIYSNNGISMYKANYSDLEEMNSMLDNQNEIVWQTRARGYFEEGIFKSTSLDGLKLKNREMQLKFAPIFKEFFISNNLTFSWFNDNVFIKVKPDANYSQDFTGDIFENSICAIYFLNDNYDGGHINFIDKGISLTPQKDSLLIFDAKSENKYIIENISAGEIRVGISFIRK